MKARGVRSWPVAPMLLLAAHAAGAADLDGIVRSGRLRVIVERSDVDASAIFAKRANDFEREILDSFAAKQQLKVALVEVGSAQERIAALSAGRGDVIGGLVVTPERSRQVRFTAEIFPVRHVVLTRRPQAAVATVAQLHGMRVGTVPGTSWAEELRAVKMPAARIDASYKTPDVLVAALLDGRVEAIVLSTRYAILARQRQPDLELGLMLGKASSVAYAVRPDQPVLAAALDEHIGALRRTPAWSRLVIKYFGDAGLEVLQRAREQ
jgi:ABC-type amino acid transport substrate-binding protein